MRLIWPFLIGVALAGSRQTAPPPTRIFVLGGQSNMQGRGSVSQLPAAYRSPPPNVVIWDGRSWVPLRPQGLNDTTFGPEIGFGFALAKAHPDQRIGLVKVAAGGSSMIDWNPHDSTSLYASLRQRARRALRSAPNAVLSGVLWAQGESDARSEDLARAYAARVDSLIAAFRRDLGAPRLPFFCLEVNPPYAFAAIVTRAQHALPRRVGRTYVIRGDDLPKHPDNLHYSAAGQIRLGERFELAYEALITNGR